VDELEDGLGAWAAGEGDDGEDGVVPEVDSSLFGIVAEDELELLDLSPGLDDDWLWALVELSDICAIAAEPRPRIMSAPRTAAKSDFFMVHLPVRGAATEVPVRWGRRA
jgi:hypothetical protein